MKNRLLSVGICLFLLCGMLIGCGEKNASEKTGNDNTMTKSVIEGTVTENESSEVLQSELSSSEFPSEQEQTNEESTTLTFIGHASVKLVAKDGTIILIDPRYYSEVDYEDEADYVLVTHGHDDHQPSNKVRLKDDGMLITYKDVIHGDGTYECFDFGNVKIEPVAAGGNPYHDIKNCVGYLVTLDDITVYHAGDTSMVEPMNELKNKHIDYAMYPIDGIYNMDAKAATEVANLVGAKHNIPIHEKNGDNQDKAEFFTPEGRLILKYGETIVIGE